jgi:hypothetical protein
MGRVNYFKLCRPLKRAPLSVVGTSNSGFREAPPGATFMPPLRGLRAIFDRVRFSACRRCRAEKLRFSVGLTSFSADGEAELHRSAITTAAVPLYLRKSCAFPLAAQTLRGCAARLGSRSSGIAARDQITDRKGKAFPQIDGQSPIRLMLLFCCYGCGC